MKAPRRIALVSALALMPLAAASQSVVDPNLEIEALRTSGTLNAPTGFVFLEPNKFLVTEKNTGIVQIMEDGVVTGNALDLNVSNNSERGLLSIELDPEFSTNNLVYLFYSARSTSGDGSGSILANRVSRFTWNGTNLVSEQILIDLPGTPGPNHDGGIIRFGPPSAAPADKKLFIIIGDLNRFNQTQNYSTGAAADDTGVVVRINRDGSVPTDGPFAGVSGATDAHRRMYAYGIRNSFGMDFDPLSDRLWDTENGAGSYDEINLIEPGFNSGWRHIMGPLASGVFEGAPSLIQFDGIGTYADPAYSWQSVVAPTALHFFTGTGLGPGYQHDMFVGANNNGRLYRFQLNGQRDALVLTGVLADRVANTGDDQSQTFFGQGFGVVTDIDTGPDGNLYVLSLNLGQIYRIKGPLSEVTSWSIY